MRALLLVVVLAGCSNVEPKVSNDPPAPCVLDSECTGRGYCTAAGVCRRDCFVDEHCIGPDLGGQCNAQGKCIYPPDASAPSDAGGEVAMDAGDMDAGEVGP